jgi:phosphopantetheinyl transferase (holo-ACP synthase)
MFGNDIIDLNYSRQESNWQRKGWLAKLFTPTEQSYIKQAKDKEQIIWLFWSMKEAAYKIYNRSSNQTFYAPAAFQCSLHHHDTSTASGQVSYHDAIYITATSINAAFIHTVARAPGYTLPISIQLENTEQQKLQLPKNQSLHRDASSIPFLMNNNTGVTSMASLSHHGKYEAIVF